MTGTLDAPLVNQDLAVLARAFPGLVIRSIAPNLALAGQFELSHEGTVFDAYDVEIEVREFPKLEPRVFERGGRVKQGQHRNPDGSCCTGVFEVWRAQNPGATLVDFLSGPVRHFFLGHHSFEKTGEWPFGERSHSAPGVVEAAAELLGIRANKNEVARYLRALVNERYNSNQLCPCGSRRRAGICHDRVIRDLRHRIDRRDARAVLDRLKALDSTVRDRQEWRRPEIVARLSRRYLR